MNTVMALKKQPTKIDEAIHRLRSVLDKVDKKEVAVGYPVGVTGLGVPEPAYDDEASIIEVALKNNYGLGVPRRAFMDLASKYMEETYKEVMDQLGPKLMRGEAELEKVLDVAGTAAAEDIRKAITQGNWLPNSQLTIVLKGSDVPLIDTMTMHNRATHLVRDKQ